MLSLFWDAAGVQGGAWEQIGGSRMPIPLMYVMATLKWLYTLTPFHPRCLRPLHPIIVSINIMAEDRRTDDP